MTYQKKSTPIPQKYPYPTKVPLGVVLSYTNTEIRTLKNLKDNSLRFGMQKTHSNPDSLEMFHWMVATTKHFNSICPTAFSVPARPDTKRVKNFIACLSNLQRGTFWNRTWDTGWIERNKVAIPKKGESHHCQGLPTEDIKALVYKAAHRYSKAKLDSKFWFPGDRKFKISLDEFIYLFNDKIGIEGQSHFMYWSIHTPTLRYNTALSEDILKQEGLNGRKLAGICYNRNANKIQDWKEPDWQVFLSSASRLVLWYQKNQKHLSTINPLWGTHIGNVGKLFDKLGAYYNEGGWLGMPSLPYPKQETAMWSQFTKWLKTDYGIDLTPEGNGAAGPAQPSAAPLSTERAEALLNKIWEN